MYLTSLVDLNVKQLTSLSPQLLRTMTVRSASAASSTCASRTGRRWLNDGRRVADSAEAPRGRHEHGAMLHAGWTARTMWMNVEVTTRG
ncbi:hypothetical protein Pcac1_g10295 [Phytophthora cactorum]|nr:hypothetical protein Pcac1_g10295 [Phytophthora cactorum]